MTKVSFILERTLYFTDSGLESCKNYYHIISVVREFMEKFIFNINLLCFFIWKALIFIITNILIIFINFWKKTYKILLTFGILGKIIYKLMTLTCKMYTVRNVRKFTKLLFYKGNVKFDNIYDFFKKIILKL